MNISSHKIKGYTIILIPAKGGMTLVQSHIHTGFIHEDKKTLGISHLMEHIMADSWKKCKGPCPQYWNKKGTSSNAFTSNTFVGYWILGLKEWNREMAEYVIAASSCDFIKKTILSDEKNAVKEELLREMNKPTWKMANTLYQEYFDNFGVKNNNNLPLQIKNLKHFKSADIEKICKKIYIPSNIMFTVVGNFKKKNVLETFRKKLKSGPQNKLQPILPNVQTKQSVIHILRKNAKKTDITISFYSTFFPWDEDTYYFNLIETILSRGLESILMDHLRTKLNLIYSVGMDIMVDNMGTITTVNMSTQDKNIKDVVEHTIGKIRQFTVGDYHSDFLTGAKNKQLVEAETTCKNVEFLSEFYGEQYSSQILRKKKKIISHEKLVSKIKKVTKKDIVKISNKLFDFKTMKVIYMGKTKSHTTI